MAEEPTPFDAADEAVSIDKEAFAAACRADPDRTGRLFARLRLKLVEERSCLGDFLAICGC